MKNIFFYSTLLLTIVFTYSVSDKAYALSNANTVRTNIRQTVEISSPSAQAQIKLQNSQEVKDKIQARKSEITQNRCERVNQNVQNRIQLHQQIRERYQKTYQNIVQNTQAKITALQEAGCNGEEMDAVLQDITTLHFRVSTFEKAYETLLATLDQNSQVACGDNPNIGQAQQEVRNQLKVMKENTTEIKNFIQSTFRVHLQSLRQVCYTQISEQSTNDNTKE